MRVAPRELRGVRRDGLLVRFAMLGPAEKINPAMRRAAWRQTAWPSDSAGDHPESTTQEPVAAGRFSTHPPP